MACVNQLSAKTWLERLDQSSYGLLLLFSLSMAETLIVPIPIETILIPWMLSHPHRRWTIAAVALAGNITAAACGYWLGVLAMEQWGNTLIGMFGGAEAYESVSSGCGLLSAERGIAAASRCRGISWVS